MTLGRRDVGRGRVERVMSGGWAIGYRSRDEVRATHKLGKIGVEKEGADEQIP